MKTWKCLLSFLQQRLGCSLPLIPLVLETPLQALGCSVFQPLCKCSGSSHPYQRSICGLSEQVSSASNLSQGTFCFFPAVQTSPREYVTSCYHPAGAAIHLLEGSPPCTGGACAALPLGTRCIPGAMGKVSMLSLLCSRRVIDPR